MDVIYFTILILHARNLIQTMIESDVKKWVSISTKIHHINGDIDTEIYFDETDQGPHECNDTRCLFNVVYNEYGWEHIFHEINWFIICFNVVDS